MVQFPRSTPLRLTLTAVLLAGVGIVLWQINSRTSRTDDAAISEVQPDGLGSSASDTGQGLASSVDSAGSDSAPSTATNSPAQGGSGSADATLGGTAGQVENGEAPGSSEFTRAEFFKPVDWGTDLSSLSGKEPQTLSFAPACKTHPRHSAMTSHPAQWAEAFTGTDSQQRWPSAATHVIDWNQFWTLNESGYQISIRWNFENPPRYSVVGYSFQSNKPDGYGAAVFPEKMNLGWDEAKQFVLDWEKGMLDKGGRLGTRTMTLAEKIFNPADVSPEDIERAEYSNSQVRGAQTGKMSCNTSHTNLSQLKCTCWF